MKILCFAVLLSVLVWFSCGSADHEMCHTDCFGGMSEHECFDGTIFAKGTYMGALYYPCDEHGRYCETWERTYTCKKGCRTDFTDFDMISETCTTSCGGGDHCCFWILCEEGRPKEVGEECSEDEDCTWYDGQHYLHEELYCDPEEGVCKAREQ